MRAFAYVAAKDSRHAVALLREHGASARILAGGTDLLVEMKAASRMPQVVVDISRADDLRGIAAVAQGLRIGALTTHSEIMESSLIREMAPVLADAAHTIGAAQTRNLGTLGGNLVTGVPSMDSGPALMALDALVTLEGPGGARQLSLDQFFVGPRKTVLHDDELLVNVVIPAKNVGKPAAFLKFGLRKGQALALVNAAASLRVECERQVATDVRIALGAVAPTVMRARAAEAYLEGRPTTSGVLAEAGRIAAGEARPISDFRASADYRRELTAVFVARVLTGARQQADARRGGST